MIRKVSKKQQERNKGKTEETKEMHLLFKKIWDDNEDEAGFCYCFETGVALHGSIYRSNSCCYHHVLAKSTYPHLKLVKENIVILDPNVHTKVENNEDSCPKVKKYKEKLLSL